MNEICVVNCLRTKFLLFSLNLRVSYMKFIRRRYVCYPEFHLRIGQKMVMLLTAHYIYGVHFDNEAFGWII